MKLHTCVRPDHHFRFHIHKPTYEVANLRENTEILPLGMMAGHEITNAQNYPTGDVQVSASDKVYEIANPFSFKGSTFINGSWADYQAKCPTAIHLPKSPDVSFSANLSAEEKNDLHNIMQKLPDPVLLSLATTSSDPVDLSHLAEIACDLSKNKDETIGLRFQRTKQGKRAIIHKPHLYEAVANNPCLPDQYKQAMVLRPGAQGGSEIVGEYTGGSHVYEYLRRNSYIPWGHYAANMANDTIRYSLEDLTLKDMQGLRHLYYQRTYARLAEDLGLAPLTRNKQATAELETCRTSILKAIDGGATPNFDATLWGWNYGFDFAPSGYRLNASHQMIHQQFAMVPAQDSSYNTFCCGDLIHDCCARYQAETNQDFFDDYIECIRNNKRFDTSDGEESLILFEDEYCLGFIPKAQTSQWEVQIMTTCKAGNILALSTAGRASIDTAFYRIVKGLHKLGLKLMCTIEYSSRFTDTSNQRLLYSFLPKLPKSPGAFSESQLRWIMGHFPEDFAIALRNAIADKE